MKSLLRHRSRHTGRTILAAVCFLFLFSVLLVLVFHFYLQPGLEAAKHMTAAQKHKQAAYASLLMAVLLTILIVGLFATFRISRFFFPPPTSPRTRTKVIDAWAEAGKRAQEKSEEDSADHND